MVADTAERDPDRVFLEEVGGRTLTYAGTQRQAMRWAAALASAGIGEGTPVVSMLDNCAETVCVWLGIAWLRAVEVPVHTAYQGRMLAYVLRDSRAEIGVVSSRYLDRIAQMADQCGAMSRLIVIDDHDQTTHATLELLDAESLLGDPMTPGPASAPRARDLATILYTSGTTGNSKGVMVPWRQFHQTVEGLDPLGEIGAGDAFYCPHPLFHNGGKTAISMMALRGGRLVLRERFSTTDFWTDVRRHHCTTAMLIGSMAAFLESQPCDPSDSDSPLRNVYPVPLPSDPKGFCDRFGVRMHAWFGMSECGVPIATRPWQADRASGCGQVRPGFRCRLIDDTGREVADGEVGELVIRADEPWMMNVGYWGMPETTVEAWRDLWLHTGDAMRCDERGNFHFVDRWKDAIRRRGENISSLEVEAHIGEYPDVVESAVIGVASEWGEQDVMAYIVAVEGAYLRPEELIAFLAPRMPAFMVPRYIEMVPDLPRTATGKVRKVELRGRPRTDAWDRNRGHDRRFVANCKPDPGSLDTGEL
jgi:crotonobetaine/carnitine-CoA ligase